MFYFLLANDMLRRVGSLPEGVLPPWIEKRRLDDWRLCGMITSGNFGEVFIAENSEGKRKALKIFAPSENDRRAFDIECDGMMRMIGLRHPNLVPVETFGRTEHCLYYTMPLADELFANPFYVPYTLRNRMVRRVFGTGIRFDDLTEAHLLKIAASVLDALDFLHGKGLLHRDVKPDNIMRLNGAWCLGDPGLIAPRRPRCFAGTPGFYPEKKGFRANAGSDLYALGKTLYCVATRMKPENYPLVPKYYDYSRYPRIRRIYRNAVEGKYRTAAEMKDAVASGLTSDS